MPTADFREARRLHAMLRELFVSHAGTAPDFRSLRQVLLLCDVASRAVEDGYCRGKLRLVGDYAAELFARTDHARWGRDSASGAHFLRQQVLNALELYASRLYSLEALRAAQARDTSFAWSEGSSVAPT